MCTQTHTYLLYSFEKLRSFVKVSRRKKKKIADERRPSANFRRIRKVGRRGPRKTGGTPPAATGPSLLPPRAHTYTTRRQGMEI